MAALVCAVGKGAHAQPAPELVLPEILAVELPRGVAQVGPSDSPLKELLAGAHSGSRTVTSTLAADAKRKLGPGAYPVTWNAWDGAPGSGTPAATRSARLFILPAGMTPVAMTGSESATAGNNAVHIARDASGKVHMIWKSSGRDGQRDGAYYRRAAVVNGAVKFETAPVFLAGDGPGDWNAYTALAVSGDNVQLIWQGSGTVHTRRVSAGVMGPIIDTRLTSEGRDVGPVIAFDPKGGMHIVTPSGFYGFSGDGGQNWSSEKVPLPQGAALKTVSLCADGTGTVHVAFTAPVNAAYWQLRTISRTPKGAWVDPTDVLARAPGWGAPKGSDELLADWVHIAADNHGGLHLTWHGTALSHKFGNDTGFYAWKKPGGGWQTPVALMPPDRARGIKFSDAPSLALDGERALPLVFYEVEMNPETTGYDSALASLRGGHMDGAMTTVTGFVQAARAAKHPDTAMGSRFPAAAPAVWHGADGHATLDVLEMLQPPSQPKGGNVVVYHRVDLGGTAPPHP